MRKGKVNVMKKSKRTIIGFTLILTMLFSTVSALGQSDGLFDNIDYAKGTKIRVILEGEQLEFDTAPQIIKGRTLVPMRKIFEALGLDVTWDQTLQTARGKNETMDILFSIGNTKASINGQEYAMDVPAQIIGASTMVPLRFLSENMDYNVVWNDTAQLILLSKEPIVEWRYTGFEAQTPYKEYENKYINGEITKDFRYTGENHDATFVNLYKKDGSLVQNVPEFKVKDFSKDWASKSSFAGKTYWVHIDALTKGIRTNPIYIDEDMMELNINAIKDTMEVGNYVKIKLNEQYFNLKTWKKVIGTQSSTLYSTMDETLLNEATIESYDTLFKAEINDEYDVVVAFKTLNGIVLNMDSDKTYTVLEKSPKAFNWDATTWARIDENIPWTGMTQDMLLVQFKMKPDQETKLTTKFNDLELWVYSEDYGDSIYYFKDKVLTNIL